VSWDSAVGSSQVIVGISRLPCRAPCPAPTEGFGTAGVVIFRDVFLLKDLSKREGIQVIIRVLRLPSPAPLGEFETEGVMVFRDVLESEGLLRGKGRD
jgi:hypothetical protein